MKNMELAARGEHSLQSYKIRNVRNSNTADELNASEVDGKSFYSEARHRVHFNFEEKDEDYVDGQDSPPQPHKVGFITTVKQRHHETERQKHMSDYIHHKDDDLSEYKTSIQKRGLKVAAEGFDY